MKKQLNIGIVVLSLCVCLGTCGCGSQSSSQADKSITDTSVTTPSDSSTNSAANSSTEEKTQLKTSSVSANGKWLTACAAKSAGGENKSPELSWAAVDGASCYAVFMYDTTAGEWLHMKATGITKTSLAFGELDDKEYVGPYPPDGNHTYEVVVYALKAEADSYFGYINTTSSAKMTEKKIDISNGESGNLIAKMTFSADYATGDKNT